jgi:hypothetical protein
MAHLGFLTGSHGLQRCGIPPGNWSVGSDTEEVTGSNPVAPTSNNGIPRLDDAPTRQRFARESLCVVVRALLASSLNRSIRQWGEEFELARRAGSPEHDRSVLPRLTVARSELARQLEERVAHGQELLKRSITEPITETGLRTFLSDCRRWDDYNVTLLRRSFSTSEPAEEYRPRVAAAVWTPGREPTLSEKVVRARSSVGRCIQVLVSLQHRLELYEEDMAKSWPHSKPHADPGSWDTIFLVHGHSEAAKQAVARFLADIPERSVGRLE